MSKEPRPLRHVPAEECSSDTPQSGGMTRTAAVSASTVGSEAIFMGTTTMAPGAVSEPHHHGALETAIFVRSGNPVFVFLEDEREVRIETKPGDFVYVPPFTPHIEENPSSEPAVVVLARTSQESVVENLPGLRAAPEASHA